MSKHDTVGTALAKNKKTQEQKNAAETEQRFSEQCWLVDHMSEIQGVHVAGKGMGAGTTRISVGGQGGQFPFYKIKGDPATAINILTTKTGEGGFFSLTPEKLGALTPSIEFSVSNKRTKGKMVPLVFSKEMSYMGLHESTVAEILAGSRARGDGVGIKSFNYKYIGTNSYSASKLIDAELVLYFQEMQDLEKEQANGARWLDLIIPVGVPSSSANLFVKVGWSLPTDTTILNMKEKYSIEQAMALFHLTYKKHTFRFNEDGSIQLSIQYVARHEEILGDRKYDLFAPSMTNLSKNTSGQAAARKRNVEALKAARSAMAKHEKALKGKDLKASKRKLRSLEASINATNHEAQAQLDLSRIDRYRKIVEWLSENKRIMTAAVSAEALDFYRHVRNTHTAKDFAKAMVKGGHITEGEEEFWAKSIEQSINPPTSGPPPNFSKKATWDAVRKRRESKYRSMGSSNVHAWSATKDGRFDFQGAMNKTQQAQESATKAIKKSAQAGESIETGDKEYSKGVKIINEELLQNPAEHRQGDPSQKWVRWFYLGDLLEFIFTGQGTGLGTTTSYASSADYVRPLIGDFRIKSSNVIGLKPLESINIADIPISWSYFTEWFRDEVVRSKRDSYPLDVFLSDVINLIVNALGPDCYGVMRDSLQVETNISILPMFGHGIGNGGRVDKVIAAAKGDNTCTVGEIKGAGNAKQGTKLGPDSIKHYLFIYSELEVVDTTAGAPTDDKQGTHTIFIGKDMGIVKKVELSQIDIKQFMEFMLMRNKRLTSGDDDSGLSAYKTPYKAQITMVGNGIYIPGRKLYVSPASFSVADAKIKRVLGLGGYFDVTQVESKFASGLFETVVTCIQTSFPALMEGEGKDALYHKQGKIGSSDPLKASESIYKALADKGKIKIRAADLKEKSEAEGT